MNIAFCNNKLGLIGLHVTLISLIRNCSDTSQLSIWFLCVAHTVKDKLKIERLLKQESFQGEFCFIDFNPYETFGGFRSLHGDWTCYGRLLLADIIHEDRVLYLDSDLIIELDVLTINDFDLHGHFLGAVGGGRFKFTLGREFYINKLGIEPDLEYFNSGILLLDLHEWRLKNIKEECLKIARRYPMELSSCDQDLLNIVCAGNFAKLPPSFNCEWVASGEKPSVSSNMIFHFVGSPKPWDPFAFLIHNGHQTWLNYQNKTWLSRVGDFTTADITRAWNIRRSYLRYFYRKLVH